MYYDVQKSAERIRDLRADSNLTQSEAAEKMGFLSVDTISWNRDRTEEVLTA